MLPDWIQDCRNFCDSYLTEPYPRAKGAEYWREHGSELVLKIEQQMARISALETALRPFAEVLSRVPDDADDDEVFGGLLFSCGDIRAAAAAKEET